MVAASLGATAVPAAVLITSVAMLVGAVVLHECSHGSFFRAPRANAWVGRAVGLWLVMPFDSYRAGHRAHHRWAGTDRDPTAAPQGAVPERRWLTLMLHARVIPALYVAGVLTPYLLHAARHGDRRARAIWLLSIAGSLALHVTLLAQAGPLYLLVFALALWLSAVGYDLLFTNNQHLGLRAVEGTGAPPTPAVQTTYSRSTKMPLSGLLLHFNLHKEHHLSPGEPFWVLPALHAALRRRRPDVYAFTSSSLRWRARGHLTSTHLLTPRIGDPTE